MKNEIEMPKHTLYQQGNLEISLMEQKDIKKVLQLFEENDFNINPETGIKPTTTEFYDIIKENITKENRDDAVIVLRKNGKCIGYTSAFVEYDLLTIGHIAVDKQEQYKGYGRLLTHIIIQIAQNEGRNVSLVCYHENKYLKELGFQTPNGINYFFKGNQKSSNLPTIFITKEEYQKREYEKIQVQKEKFTRFLKSPIGKSLQNL